MFYAAILAAAVWLITQSFFLGMLAFLVTMLNIGIGSIGGALLEKIDRDEGSDEQKQAKKDALRRLF